MYTIGIDLGGTKTEIIAIDELGRELHRYRKPTPAGDYEGSIELIRGMVSEVESHIGEGNPVGIAIPGAIARDGAIKNANSFWLNGRDFHHDVRQALNREEVYLENDANCFALSEAEDGAAHGMNVVWGLILGTGCGSGVVCDHKIMRGRNALTGEWGHNPLPWMNADDQEFSRQVRCYCGKVGCIETFVSGTGLEHEYVRLCGRHLRGIEIGQLLSGHDATATIAYVHYLDRLARSIACYVNFLDPDVIVLGGGISNIDLLYTGLPIFIKRYIFGGEFSTPIVKAMHGDSSGVRGAAWLPRLCSESKAA